jgi:hypothetical protein
VELAAANAQALMRGEPVDYQPLIDALRADLRSQLGLDPIPDTLQIPHAGPGRPMRFPGGGNAPPGRGKA